VGGGGGCAVSQHGTEEFVMDVVETFVWNSCVCVVGVAWVMITPSFRRAKEKG